MEKKYQQKQLADHIILWHDVEDSSVECMFYFIPDPMDLNRVSNLYKTIGKYHPVFTYAIVHQKKDGENCYDIFRCSRFSYLEHCNRVRYPMKK